MQFSTVVSVAAVAAVANAQYNSTVTATATENQTTLVTITDCENHICHETVSPAIVSTATVTENNIVTKYTTWCPISNAEKPTATAPAAEKPTAEKPKPTAEKPTAEKPANPVHPTATAEKPAPTAEKPTTVVQATKKQETTIKVSSYTGAAAQVLPAAGALIAGAAALLL